MEPLLEVVDLQTKFFTPDGVVNAVNGISYEIREGETLGIVGESGCGKSVSVLSVMRLIPDPPGKIVGGEVIFEGQDLLRASAGELLRIRGNRVSMIFQDPMTSLNPVLNIGQQVGEPLQLHLGLSTSQARQRTIELLATVGIPEPERRVNDYPHQFSGGMRQRAMIAMALTCHPKLLIADEPTTALDVTVQAQIIHLVKRLQHEEGMAIIWITHDLGVIAGIADRVVVMYAGYIVEAAPVETLYADPRHPYALGLLACIPRLDEERGRKLTPIAGFPPDLIDMENSCPFAPRCGYQTDICLRENPSLRLVAPGHEIACWVDVK